MVKYDEYNTKAGKFHQSLHLLDCALEVVRSVYPLIWYSRFFEEIYIDHLGEVFGIRSLDRYKDYFFPVSLDKEDCIMRMAREIQTHISNHIMEKKLKEMYEHEQT
jgi:hypothetical protein